MRTAPHKLFIINAALIYIVSKVSKPLTELAICCQHTNGKIQLFHYFSYLFDVIKDSVEINAAD